MTRPLVAIVMGFVLCSSAVAQPPTNPTRATLARAIKAYEEFMVERALTTLDSVMLGHGELTTAELATAHKYMGAGNAVMDRKGPAVDHFVEALKLDPSTTLDPKKFSTAEMGPFVTARTQWLGSLPRDSATAMTKTLQLATIRIGSATAGTTLYADGIALGPIRAVAFWYVPAGKPSRVSIRAEKCATPWDTVWTLTPGQTLTIGRRMPSSCAP